MRKIILSETASEIFNVDMNPSEYEFFQRHREMCQKMWEEQGKKFWKRFIICFKSYSINFGIVKELPGKPDDYERFLDECFDRIRQTWVYGTFDLAKGLMSDVAVVARNTGNLQTNLYGNPNANDPFYKKDTKDVFRRLFGKPNDSSSHVKIYFVLPVYIKFGGSICNCLKLWLDAPAWDPNNDAYYIVPKHVDEDKKRRTQDPILLDFLEETNFGQKRGPIKCPEWTLGDPRFSDDKNPLYSPKSSKDKNWYDGLTFKAYKEFRMYVQQKYDRQHKESKPQPQKEERQKGEKKEEKLTLDESSETYLDGPGDFRVKVTKIMDENGVVKKEDGKESVVLEILPKDPLLAKKVSGRTREYLKHLPEFGGPPLTPTKDKKKPVHIYVPNEEEEREIRANMPPNPYRHLNLTESQRRNLPSPYHLTDTERMRLEAKRIEQEREVAILREIVQRQERHSATFEKDLDEDGKTKGGTLHFDFATGPDSGPSKQQFTEEVSQIMKDNLCDVPNIPNSVWNKVEQSQSKERTKDRLRKKLAQKRGDHNHHHMFPPGLSGPGWTHYEEGPGGRIMALDQTPHANEIKKTEDLLAENEKANEILKQKKREKIYKTPLVVEAKDILTEKKKRQNVTIVTSLDSDEDDLHELSVRNRIKQALYENYQLEHGSDDERNLVLEHGDKQKRIEEMIKKAHRQHVKGEEAKKKPKAGYGKGDIYEPLTITEIDDDYEITTKENTSAKGKSTNKPKEMDTISKSSESDADKKIKRVCSNCGKSEMKLKQFKKCSKCKQENTVPARYYCGKDCQMNDWVKRHKAEHKMNSLVN